jgi:hypothetical protein
MHRRSPLGSREEIEARLRARANAPEPPPLEATRALLRRHWADADSDEEIRGELVRRAAYNPRPLRAALRAIEAVIADPPQDGTLAYMIAFDANMQLDDPSDQGALEYLREIAGLLREVLESKSSQ